MKEQYTQNKIIKYVESLGGYAVNVIVSSKSGTSDLLCCINGLFVSIEVKKRGEKPTKLQIFKMKKVIRARGRAILGDNFKDVVAKINAIDIL